MPTPAPEPTDATTAVPPVAERFPFRVRSYRILIKPDPRRRSLIRMTDQAQEASDGRHWSGLTVHTATILAVGPGLKIAYREGGSIWKGYRDEEGVARWPMHGLKAGDRILYRCWSGHDVVIRGEKLEIIIANSVDAKILPDGKLDLIEDRLLARRRPHLERTRGGIWIPEIAQRESLEGTVLQTGPGKVITNGTVMPFDAQVGERVAWRPMKGVDVSMHMPDKKSQTILLFETDLIGVLEGEEHFEPVVSLARQQ